MIYTSDHDPLTVLADAEVSGTLAIITHIEGPSYRSLGATMAILSDGTHVGTLSSGCIEADLVHHAKAASQQGKPVTIRYGQGSQFMDIQLPCGGRLDVTLIPSPDPGVLKELIFLLNQRQVCHFLVDLKTGKISVEADIQDIQKDNIFSVRMLPELRFLVFGKGPEASAFVSLTHTSSFPSILISPDLNMCLNAQNIGCPMLRLQKPEFPEEVLVDQRTAIVLFFHDHDWEPPILMAALSSSAFYIGAQGSRRANQSLVKELRILDVPEQQIEKLKGPIGLIPSTRDARTLAVSVLAEIMSEAQREC